MGGSLTPLWWFCTYYWYLLGIKCTLFVGFYFSAATLLGNLVYCCTLCDHCCYLLFILFCRGRLFLRGFTNITDFLISFGG